MANILGIEIDLIFLIEWNYKFTIRFRILLQIYLRWNGNYWFNIRFKAIKKEGRIEGKRISSIYFTLLSLMNDTE